MTDRYKGVIVTFERDIRDDDAAPLLTAIRMLRGVLEVSPLTADVGDLIARVRADAEWRERIYAILKSAG